MIFTVCMILFIGSSLFLSSEISALFVFNFHEYNQRRFLSIQLVNKQRQKIDCSVIVQIRAFRFSGKSADVEVIVV